MDRFKYLNKRGLIPENTICPFHKICTYKIKDCDRPREISFSCGSARLLDMIVSEKYNKNK